MRADPADLAMKNLQRLVARDPLLRDIVNPSMTQGARKSRFVPAVDVMETDEGWTLFLEVPGVHREALKVRLDGTKLMVSGTKAASAIGRARVSERENGAFRREFLLPFQVRPDAIAAKLEDGVLEISLPRTGQSSVRDVPVE